MIGHPRDHPFADLMPRLTQRAASLAVIALLALSSGCGDSPTAPRPLGDGVIAPGSLVRGTIQSTADTAHFSLVLTGGSGGIVYLMAKGDLLRLEVRDSSGKLITTTGDMFNTTRPERSGTAIIPASPFRYHVDVSMVNGTAPSDFEIRVVAASNAPEHVPQTLTIGSVVRGEDLDHAYDVDSFTVSVDHSELVNLYLRKTMRSASVVTARIFRAGVMEYPGGVSAAEGDTVLGGVGSGRFTLAAGSTYWIRVYYDNADTARTPYELELQRIDTAPESAPRVLVVGDTIHESIDYLGDIDDFTLNGAPGARYNLFAEAGGDAPHQVTAQLVILDGGARAVTAIAGGAPLAANATGVFSLPSSGTMDIHVTAGAGYERGRVGPYRIFAYPIDSGTESVGAALAPGRVTSGSIDMLGDIDEFRLTVAADTVVNIVIRRPRGPAPLTFTLRDPSGGVVAQRTLGVLPTPGDTAALGTRTLTAGTWTLTVETSSSTAGGFTGDYEIFPRPIATAPESLPGSIAIGDTLAGESLDVAGDVDRFAVSLNASDSVYVYLRAATPGVHVGAGLRRASDGMYFGTNAFNYEAGGTTTQSNLFVAPTAGTYYVEVSGETGGMNQGETGAYEVGLPRITAAPEDRAASFALGDTVASALDVVGDADDYTLLAPAGTEVTGGFRKDYPFGGEIRFVDPGTGAVLGQSTGSFEGFGRVTVPAGGALRVRVVNQPDCGGYGCYGPVYRTDYRFWVVAVNRAPESRAAAFAIGDTVSGEAIDPVGDIDEFTFDATAGDTVNVYFQTPMGTWGYQGLTMTLIDATTGATLGTLSSNNPNASLEDIALTRVALPSSGSYMVRVLGTNAADNKGAFRFRVARPGQ